MDVKSRLRGDSRAALAVKPDDVLDLLRDCVRVRTRQIDLIDDRKNFQIMVESQIDISERLRLDSLRRVDDENRAVAGRE